MSLKRALHLLVVGLLMAAVMAACGDNTATTAPAATTAAATTAAATTAAATTAAATTAAATTAAATTAAATTAAATTAAATTAAATAAAGGAADLISTPQFDKNGKKGGSLATSFAGQFPSLLQPYFLGETVAVNVARMVWGYLVGQDNNSKYYAYLLSEVPTLENGDVKVTSDNKMDITLKLKPGIKWSDGSPLTSKDLAFTWKWVTDPDNSGVYVDTASWKLITSVDTPDDSTAVLHFSQIFGPYLNFLNGFYPLPEKVWSAIPGKSSPDKNPESTKPTITSGPFKVDEFTPDDRIVLSRNDNFQPVWGFTAYLDKVIFRNTSDTNAALAAVGKGDLDEAENLDDNSGPAASKVPNAKFDIAQQYSWEYLQYNLSNPLFQDVNVRKALLMAIDREALVKQFRTPKTVVLPVNTSPLSPYVSSLLTSLKPLAFDPEGAKKMLDDAGWKVGSDGVREKDGKKLSFTLSSTTAPVRKATAEVMLTYWKAIGVQANFQGYSSTQFFGPWGNDGILARGKYDIGMFAQTADVDPDSGYCNYHSSCIPTDANKGNGANYGRINDPDIDKALDAERSSADQAKRKAAFETFYKILYDKQYEGSLYSRVNNYVVSNKVQNFKANPTTDANFWNAVELWVQQ
ncbi:MAG TPA: peptide ABC transporter substrate-binding protein [Chloroflexia bacterium]|nr:peptide ABC transporter substrate-binding protein [Chloroflexia bacterium]